MGIDKNHKEDKDDMGRLTAAVKNLGHYYGVSGAFSWIGFEPERM